MTGIERLRDVACNKTVRLTALLRDIADQIERETLPRPRFEDGELVRCGDMAMFGNKPREVVEYEVNDCGVAILHTYGDCWSLLHGQRLKRPEPPKVLDADGVEIKVGDEVWSTNDSGLVCHPFSFIVTEVEAHLVHGDGIGVLPCQVAHKRPEPYDTWEELEKCSKDPCEYFGGNKNCKECPVELGNVAWSCTKAMAKDLVRRCKALAGVE